MALSGMHIVFGWGNASGRRNEPFLLKPASSETMANAGTSTITAPATGSNGLPIAYLRASADCYAAAAAAPNATSGTRVFVPANVDFVFYVNPSDKIAWILA